MSIAASFKGVSEINFLFEWLQSEFSLNFIIFFNLSSYIFCHQKRSNNIYLPDIPLSILPVIYKAAPGNGFRKDVAFEMCAEIYVYYFVIFALSLRVPGPWEMNILFQFHKTFGLSI